MTDFLSLFFQILFYTLAYAIFIRAILSWFSNTRGNQFVMFLYQITEPILSPLRRIIPPIGGTFDITPMIAMIILFLAAQYAATLR